MANRPTIPLPRVVGEGDTGLDVLAYRRALHSLGLVRHGGQGRFEANMVQGVLAFQAHANIARTGTICRRTYALLFQHIDGSGRAKLETFARRQEVRDRMVAEQRWALRNAGQIHHPRPGRRLPAETVLALQRWQAHELPITVDCSEYAASIAAASGAPDPTGTSFGLRGSVLAGTMLSHSREIEMQELKPGDYVVFGPTSGEHVCVVLSADDADDPLLTSHDPEGGPLEIALSAARRIHDPPVRFLSAGIM